MKEILWNQFGACIDMDYPILEILLYNLRHTQNHTAQLNLHLSQDLDQHMEWSFRAGDIDV